MKIVQHPSAKTTPQSLLAEALGFAETMEDAVLIWTDKATGDSHAAWSEQMGKDLAAYVIVLHEVARAQILGDRS